MVPGISSRVEIVYGRNPVREALRGRRVVRRVFVSRKSERSKTLEDIKKKSAERGIRLAIVDPIEIERMAPGAVHQGICAEVDLFGYLEIEDLIADRESLSLLLILDGIEDPQNFGSLLRSAECSGATGIVIPKDRSARVTPAVCKASAGASEHVKIAMVPNLVSAMKKIKEAGIWIYATASDAETVFWNADFTLPTAIVMGSEGKGIRRLVAENCDLAVRIPLEGKIESLNAAVAGGLMLYEVLRQRKNQTI